MKARVLLVAAFALGAHGASAAAAGASDMPGSSRIAALAREIETGKREAVASFWKEIEGNAPVVPLWDGEAKGLLAEEFLGSARLPLEFYIEVGRYETTLPFSQLLETRRVRDVLRAKGYRVTYSEFVGGHNEVCWRGSFADAIMALTGKQ